MAEQQVRARIRRGDKTVSAYNNNGEEVQEKKEEQYSKVEELRVPQSKEDDLVGKVKMIMMHGAIRYNTAASCIVGEIRNIYFKSISRPDSYDIQILNYMDKILFNNLTDIIEGIMHYGSGCFPKDMVEQIITDVINIMETQPNMKAIFHVIDRVYAEF